MKHIVVIISLFLTTATFASSDPAPCSNLFFSEYVEGSSYNKALEIFNPTLATIDLSHYKVFISYNGGAQVGSIHLTGTIAPSATFVIANSSASSALLTHANQTSGALLFNGNDAVALIDSLTSDTLDIIGVIGDNPGLAWATYSGDQTMDQTLIRRDTVHNGMLTWSDPNNQAAGSYNTWDGFPIDTYDFLGSHTMTACASVINPQVYFTQSSQSVSESAGTVTINLGITSANGVATTVQVALASGGTATQGSDFTFSGPQTITFPAGSAATQTVTIPIIDDTQTEPTEYFVLHLQSATNNGTITTVNDTVYIDDNDGFSSMVVFVQGTQTVHEQDGSVTVQLSITPSNPNATTVDVSLVPTLSTATQGSDFTFSSPQTVTFPAGSSVLQSINIPIINDNVFEPTEHFTLALSNVTGGATLGNADTTVITILDNDPNAVNELQSQDMHVYPNPVTTLCEITALTPMQSLRVYNITGQLVLQAEPHAAVYKLDMHEMVAGVYMIEAVTAEGTLHYRIVKQ